MIDIKAENMKEVLSLASNGILLSSSVTDAGIHRIAISELVSEGFLEKSSKGINVLTDTIEDEYYLLQKKYGRGVFSHSTALYLHGYSDRVPLRFHMTFPAGYNCVSIKEERIDVTRVSKDNYQLGIVTIESPYGNKIKIYDLERCLCDVLRGRGNDVQIVQSAFKQYVRNGDRDINKLIRYAKQLRVESKVRTYLEVLL